jgi:MFS family permease
VLGLAQGLSYRLLTLGARHMLKALPSALALFQGVALLLLGTGLLNTLITLRGMAEGFSESMLGLLMSGYFAGYLLGSWVTAPLIKRIGHIRAFAFCAALACIITLLHAMIINPWVWLLLRVMLGLALVTLYMVIESWLNAEASGETRGRVFAAYMFINLGALTLAQQLLQLGSILNFVLFALAAMLISAATLPITATRHPQPTLPDVPGVNMMQLARRSPLAVVAAVLSGLALSAFWGMAPVYAGQRGFETSEVASLMSLTVLGGALLQWPIGRLSDRYYRPVVLLWVTGLAALVSLIMSMLPAATPLWIAAFFWGGLSFSTYSIAVTHMIDRLAPEDVLAGSAGMLVLNGLGAAFGPVLAGAVMHWLGAPGLPLYHAVTLGLLAGFTLLRLHQVREEARRQAQHVTMMNTSPTVLEMMPEAQEVEQDTSGNLSALPEDEGAPSTPADETEPPAPRPEPPH